MKILSIRIQNLASLAGKTEINFNEEPLRSAGIFAITGRTGSGKSTILDALCLALYGKTPRYRLADNGIDVADVKGSTIKQGDVRGILRDGSSSGYAEVDFVGTDDQHYRATWSVRRARNKAEGNLQPYDMSLKNISTDQDIPGKKTELLPEIERLVGLNFEQFTRSVLLAQGDFTAFLKAGKDEKSSLLEKLTGTHIYSEISKKVYEHQKEESKQLELLDVQREGITTLTTEELTDLQEKKQELGDTIKVEENQIAALDKEVNWHEQWTKLEESVKSAKEQNDNAIKAKAEAKSREDQFKQITRIQSVRPILTELQSTQKQHAFKSENEATLATTIAALVEQKTVSDTFFEQANQALINQDKKQQDAQPLLNEAKALDVQLKEKAEQLKLALDEVAMVTKKEKQQIDECSKTKKELEAAEKEIVKLKQWKGDNENRQPIAEQEHLILSKLSDAESILEGLQDYNASIQTAQESITKSTKEKQSLIEQQKAIQTTLKQSKEEYQSLNTALSKITIQNVDKEKTSLDTSIEDVVEASAQWKLLSSALLEKEKSQRELKANREAQEQNSIQLAKAKKLLETKILEKEASLKMLERAKLAAAQSVDELRQQLEPEEPCPVCGSTSHPYASHNPELDHVLSELETEHAKIDAEYTKQLTLHTTLSQTAVQLAKLIEGQEEHTQQNNEELDDLETSWSKFKISANCNEQPISERASWLQQQLNLKKSRQLQLQTEIKSYNKLKQQLEVQKAELTSLEKQFDQIENNIKDTDRTLQSLETQKKSDTTQQRDIQKKLEILRQALTVYFSSEQWFDNWQSNPGAFVSRIKEFASSWKTNIAELDTNIRKQELQTEKIKGLKENLGITSVEVKANEQKLAGLQDRNKALADQRNALFEGTLVTEVEAKLKTAIEHARQTLEEQRLKVEKLQGDITRNLAQQEQLTKDIGGLTKQEKTLKEQLKDWIANYNRQYETELNKEELIALLAFSQDWIETERNNLRTIEDVAMQAKSILEERTKSLIAHTKQRISERTLEELTTLRAEVQESLRTISQRSNEIDFKIKEDITNKQRIGTLLESINKQTAIVENWAKLNEIIGSADGKKFRQIAQEYTLDVLLSYANVHLEVLSKRYILQRIPNSLGLQVLDQDMGDEVRTVYSLSGGESFLVSLALALGLASLSSSRMKVESLFIDEGFGSLDPATLNVAMDALERLHNQGRKVGVISHVQEMTERIPVQIKVSKQQSGKSKVDVVGY